MRDKLHLVGFFILFACSSSSTQAVITEEDRVQTEETILQTITTIPQTTTSTVTTIALPTERSYEDNLLKINQYLLVDNIDSTVYKDSYYIRFKARWNLINRLNLIFDNECESYKRPDVKEKSFSSTLGVNIKNGTNPCIQADEIIAIQIEGTTNNGGAKFTTFYKNGYYTTTKYDKNHIDNAAVAFCCHEIDFIKINLELKKLKDHLSNPTTTTSTTTTTTQPRYILPKVKITTCPNTYTMPSNLVNLSVDYSIVGGSSEVVSFTFERFDVVNGVNSNNSETYSAQQALDAGVELPKNLNEEAYIKSTFLIQNQNEKRSFKFKIIATDSQGKTSSSECEFIMNPNGTEVIGDNEAPIWGNDPISFSKVNPGYLDILWGQATDNIGISVYKIYANGVLKSTVNFGTNRTTIVGLVPDTEYLFEIIACDEAGNCSTNNPTNTKKTPPTNSSGGSQNVGSIPNGLFEITYLNKGFGWNSTLYTYPNNQANSQPVALEFTEGNEDNCDSINFWFSNGSNLVLDFIIGTKPLSNCSRWITAATQGVNFTILVREQFVNSSYEKMCGLYELNLVEIRYFGDKYLSYWRNGNLQYFINGSELNGQGTHNLNLSVLDFNVDDYDGQC